MFILIILIIALIVFFVIRNKKKKDALSGSYYVSQPVEENYQEEPISTPPAADWGLDEEDVDEDKTISIWD